MTFYLPLPAFSVVMPSLPESIKAVDDSLLKIKKEITSSNIKSDTFDNLTEKMYKTVQRRKQLFEYSEKMENRIAIVNSEVDQKIEDLNGGKKELIANVRHEYEDKTAQLPVIDLSMLKGTTTGLSKIMTNSTETLKTKKDKFSVDFREQMTRFMGCVKTNFTSSTFLPSSIGGTSSISNTIDVIDDALSVIKEQMSKVEATSDDFFKLNEKVCELVKRRKLLSKFSEDLATSIETINNETFKKIEELENARRELIVGIRQEFAKMAAALPAIDEIQFIEENISKPSELSEPTVTSTDTTVQTVKNYTQKYFNDYKNISDKDNFFHAASCSYYQKYVSTKYEHLIERHAKELLQAANLPADMQYPLSLVDIDKIIHSMIGIQRFFVILDTSLRVILTNLSGTTEIVFNTIRLLIYDSDLKKFAPISSKMKNKKWFCFMCFRYEQSIKKCLQRHCPICLKSFDSNAFNCFKPSPESKPFVCTACDAFCQTKECYAAHRQICPLSIQEIHHDVLELIKCD